MNEDLLIAGDSLRIARDAIDKVINEGNLDKQSEDRLVRLFNRVSGCCNSYSKIERLIDSKILPQPTLPLND